MGNETTHNAKESVTLLPGKHSLPVVPPFLQVVEEQNRSPVQVGPVCPPPPTTPEKGYQKPAAGLLIPAARAGGKPSQTLGAHVARVAGALETLAVDGRMLIVAGAAAAARAGQEGAFIFVWGNGSSAAEAGLA
jgi:hypothetical protein